jgi:hypothetical protein
LQHRAEHNALMSSCQNLPGFQREVNEHECHCFLLGPGNQECRRRLQPDPVCDLNRGSDR